MIRGPAEAEPSPDERAPKLVLGPLLRYLGASEATVWVETDRPCEVAVLGCRARTFRVAAHHYAVVQIAGLEPGRVYPFEVALDGAASWPEPGSPFPQSVIHPLDPSVPLTLLFGSCRAVAPHEPPFTLSRDRHPLGRGPDALHALTRRLRGEPPTEWPRVLLLLGDQIYADEVSPRTLAFIREHRDTRVEPGEEVATFEEYARLYQESWQDPSVRWLLSTVSTTMLWDDHEVHDDWNISGPWIDAMRRKPWWQERIVGAYMAYWLYQHLGNLSPRELATDELFRQVQAAEDAEPVLRAFALQAASQADGRRWSVCRDFGRTRLLAVDCRGGRVLAPGTRSMLDDDAWRWVEEHTVGDFDHLLIALSDPYLLTPSIHHLEAWSEAVCDGAWGRAFAALGERIRQALDLDHWAAFRQSFERLTELLRQVGAGERGRAPATIVALSGDVHNCYLAQATFPPGAGVQSRVYQAVCSPLRNPLGRWERRVLRGLNARAAEILGRVLAAAAGVVPPSVGWTYRGGPWFGNQLGTLHLDGRRALLRIEEAVQREGDGASLEGVFQQELT